MICQIFETAASCMLLTLLLLQGLPQLARSACCGTCSAQTTVRKTPKAPAAAPQATATTIFGEVAKDGDGHGLVLAPPLTPLMTLYQCPFPAPLKTPRPGQGLVHTLIQNPLVITSATYSTVNQTVTVQVDAVVAATAEGGIMTDMVTMAGAVPAMAGLAPDPTRSLSMSLSLSTLHTTL
jgi:hypothetical protein